LISQFAAQSIRMRPPQFGADITNQANNEPNLAAVMHCTRMAGRAIIRVVGRCNDAKENKNLGEYLEKLKFYSTNSKPAVR